MSVAFALAVGPFAASLVNRFGCRTVSIVGCGACALSLTMASFAKSLIILYISYSVLGIGGGSVSLASVAIVRKCFKKRRSIALGIALAGQGLGTMALSQVLQTLVTALHWRKTLRIFAGTLFLNSFFSVLYDPKMETASSSEDLPSEDAGQRLQSKRFTFHCSVWKVPAFLVLGATVLFFMFGRSTNYVHLVRN